MSTTESLAAEGLTTVVGYNSNDFDNSFGWEGLGYDRSFGRVNSNVRRTKQTLTSLVSTKATVWHETITTVWFQNKSHSLVIAMLNQTNAL